MHAQAAAPTLLDDWRSRRQRLLNLSEPGRQLVELHVQILDYLLSRYKHAPEAARPARFPMATSLYVNDRAIVVHHHVWEGKVGGVKTEHEAEDRVRSLVSRIVSPNRHDTSAERPPWLDDVDRPSPSSRTLGRWQNINKALRWRCDVLGPIEAALGVSPYLPRPALEYLLERLADPRYGDLRAAIALTRCQNRSVPWYAVHAWCKRIVAGRRDPVTQALEEFFCQPETLPAVLPHIRTCLADPDSQVRLAAAGGIARIGTLDDVGLLSDLLALSPQPDENPSEREALLEAMRTLSRPAAPEDE